jgi:hypothetical protein
MTADAACELLDYFGQRGVLFGPLVQDRPKHLELAALAGHLAGRLLGRAVT